ncbi:hypothetical protein DFH06DRAFT_1111100 [Mycena polygramma]|nr:hypothetical protein DFH06DRAFT_1111100 [Mycena polygramma]
MHRCLRIPEILEIIFSSVLDLEPDFQRPRSLAALARGCRIFKDPALDVLWRKQYTFSNIVYSMPSDLFEMSSRRVVRRILRPIVEADWARPLTYMARVRNFECSYSYSYDRLSMDCDILDVLAMSLPGPCLFPRLECLRWDQYGGEFRFIQVLLAPTLTDISIECQPIHLSLLSSIARTCPALRDITLEVPSGHSSEVLPPLSDLMRRLPNMQSVQLKLPDLVWETIRDIASVRNLELLQLKSLPLAPDPRLYSALRIPGFSALRTLEIQGVPVCAAQLFLGMFRDISLEVLDLSMRCCVLTGATKSFHSSIAAAVTHSSLTYLILDHAGDEAPTSSESSYNFEDSCIRPLLCFNNLIHVSITSPLGFSITNSMVEEMAQAWPHVEKLSLIPLAQHERPRLTLVCLTSLAKHCPRLNSLAISFEAAVVPPISTSQRFLFTFEVMNSHVSSDTLDVARFLEAMFPDLSYITTGIEWDLDQNPAPTDSAQRREKIVMHRRWKEVEAHVNHVAVPTYNVDITISDDPAPTNLVQTNPARTSRFAKVVWVVGILGFSGYVVLLYQLFL